LISLNSNLFAIPLPKVLAITSVRGKVSPKSFTFQKKEIQLIRLRDLLKISHSSQKEPTSPPVIIFEIEGEKVGLTVDALVKIDQIFVKPLGKLLDKIGGFYGATIFGDGRMVLVLDLEGLMKWMSGPTF